MNAASPLSLWVEALVGPHFGLIESLQRVPPEPDDVPLAVFTAQLASTRPLGGLDAPRLASGAAVEVELACAACIGEAVERYAAAWIAPQSVQASRAADLAGERILPDAFALFASKQFRQSRHRFPFQCWQPADILGWTQARSLVDDRLVWLPSTFVYQPYIPAVDEPLIAPCLSTGLACSTSATGAEIAGLCEVIERDAISLAWLGAVQPPRIELPATCDNPVADSVTRIAGNLTERGFRWGLFDLTTDLALPVAVAVIEGHSPLGWIVACGSACHPQPARACLKALVEAAHCRMYVKSLVREKRTGNGGFQFQHVTSFADHARFYTSNSQYRRPLDWMIGGPRIVRWDFQENFELLDKQWLLRRAARLAAAGYEPFAVELTPPDLASLGLHVTRVLIPGLQPLHGNHHWQHLGGRRLQTLGQVFGPQVQQPWRFNSYPHPFP